MKQVVMAMAGLAMLVGGVAHAGVVVEEQQTIDRGIGSPATNKITVMVQGNKQKYIIGDGEQASVTDLDRGIRMMISNPRRTYIELPFPPRGMMMPPGAGASSLSFKATGTHEKIAGLACDDYIGTGAIGDNQVTVNGCFSMTAPGAANFSAFQKTMGAKVKGTPMAMMSEAPAGIPLKIDSSLKPKAGTHTPLTTHMIVTSVAEQQLAASTFEPPKGYTKQQMPMMGMMGPGMMGKPVIIPHAGAPMGNAPAGASSPGNKVPE